MGLLKVLLTGEDDDFEVLELDRNDADASIWDEDTVDLFASSRSAAASRRPVCDPEELTQILNRREIEQLQQRDELLARVGGLSLAVESLLRVLKEKGVLDDTDLRRMEQRVDIEDGVADGEYHPGTPPVPSHCPKCEARIPVGKRLCQLCGHRFPAE